MSNEEQPTVDPLKLELVTAQNRVKDLEYELKKAQDLLAKRTKEIEDVTSATNTISLDVYNSVQQKYEIAIKKLKKYGMYCGE